MAVMELLCIIERLEDIHTKVHGMIKPLHLATKMLFDMLRRWSLYLNRCVTMSSLEDVGAPRTTVPFYVETIFLELEVGGYVGPLLTATLKELVSGIHSSDGDVSGGGSGGSSGSGGRIGGRSRGAGRSGTSAGTGGSGGTTRVQVRYEAHLIAFYLQDR